MKKTALLTAIFFAATVCVAQDKPHSQPDKNKAIMLVEASCGQCQFGLKGDGCHLAVRIKGKSYFVDGTEIDQHGDAHAKDGFCNAVRKAKVQGEVVKDRFVATWFELQPEPKKKTD